MNLRSFPAVSSLHRAQYSSHNIVISLRSNKIRFGFVSLQFGVIMLGRPNLIDLLFVPCRWFWHFGFPGETILFERSLPKKKKKDDGKSFRWKLLLTKAWRCGIKKVALKLPKTRKRRWVYVAFQKNSRRSVGANLEAYMRIVLHCSTYSTSSSILDESRKTYQKTIVRRLLSFLNKPVSICT